VDIDESMAESNAKAQRGRRIAREMFAGALLILVVIAFFMLVAPNTMGPEPDSRATLLSAVGVLGVAIGLLWMVRILRADPEPDTAAWRYRDL
jgi:hypothetical protein